MCFALWHTSAEWKLACLMSSWIKLINLLLNIALVDGMTTNSIVDDLVQCYPFQYGMG
jgi:hypothetical protein